jgi:serine/threonine protein kinase
MHVLMTNRFPFSPAMFDDEASDNYVGSPKMTEINGKLHKHQIRFGREWNKFPDARDLCEAMLEVDVQKRPDTHKALRHPWFQYSAGRSFPLSAQAA